jgi:hypothetical protein
MLLANDHAAFDIDLVKLAGWADIGRNLRGDSLRTPVGSITKIPWEEPLAAVGKPYKLSAWSTVSGDLLAPK